MPKQKPISSDAAVRAASPGEHTVANAPGLILRVLVDAQGLARSWVVRATDGARRRRLGLGRYPDVGLARARQLAQDARGAVAEGIDPRAAPNAVSRPPRMRASSP